MRKNLWISMMAASMVLATSCTNEDLINPNEGDQVQVTFSVGMPEMGTRAFSDGLTAQKLQYAVYAVGANNELTYLNELYGQQPINLTTNVTLQLTTGKTYAVIFWAAAENAPYKVDFESKTMTVNYDNAVSNDEKRDAFYKYHKFTVNGAQTENVELRRPFAQLNIGTNDYTASANAGYEPKYSYVEVTAYSTLDLVNGTATGEEKRKFELAAIPKNETFPVDGYKYLAMNYLLMPADKETVDVTFGYSENESTVDRDRTVGSVPVQRNHRTNIYGQLLTSNVDVNVEIKPEYEDPAYGYGDEEFLSYAAANGGTYTLTHSLTLPYLEVGANFIFNIKKDVSLTSGSASDYGIIVRNGTATINNEGKIDSKGGGIGVTNGASVIYNGGDLYVDTQSTSGRYLFYLEDAGSTVTINSGNFSWDPNDNQKRAYIYAGAGTTAYVNGGTFGKASTRSGYTAGILGEGTVIITGGTFGFNPTNWLASGYKATKSGEIWTVTKE